MKKIVLVGCGSVGSRHLQALVKLPEKIEIHVIDISEKSKEIAKKRLDEVKYEKNNKKIFWYNKIDELGFSVDLVIVATTSKGKVEITKKLLEIGNKRFIIDKIVAQSKSQYDDLIEKMEQNNAKAWVNTARGYFESYQKVKDVIKNENQIQMTVNAGNRGLGCVGIHFLNLFSFFSNNYQIKLNGDNLYEKLLENKRGKDLVEFAGTIFAKTKNGSSLNLTFSPYDDLGQTIEIRTKNYHICIDEKNEEIKFLTNNQHEIKFKNELQSNLTTKIVRDIFECDDCKLPTLEDSYYVHLELFRIFNQHIKKLTNKSPELCPIT